MSARSYRGNELRIKFDFASKSNKWWPAYDCQLQQEILFRVLNHVLPADNPQQAETASHAGLRANYNCRKDLVGGTAAFKETDEGYHSLFSVCHSGFLETRINWLMPSVGNTPYPCGHTDNCQIDVQDGSSWCGRQS